MKPDVRKIKKANLLLKILIIRIMLNKKFGTRIGSITPSCFNFSHNLLEKAKITHSNYSCFKKHP